MNSLIIRSAVAQDAAVLGRLGALLVALHHEFDPDRFIPCGADTERAYGRYLIGEIERLNTTVLVAEDEGAIVGYVYGSVEGRDWMALRGPAGVIYDLVVDPKHRRQGVGRELIHQILAALAAAGAPRVVLSTAQRNGSAQRLFANAGFRATMVEMTREWPSNR